MSTVVLVLLAGLGRALCQPGAELDGHVRHFAVAASSVYAVTDRWLYQLDLNLAQFRNLSLRGLLRTEAQRSSFTFHRVPEWKDGNASFTVNTLIPYPRNRTLILCGVVECGYCELLDLADVSRLVYSEVIEVGSLIPNDASVGFLVDVGSPGTSQTYILTALQSNLTCYTRNGSVFLQNTCDKQRGAIFSFSGENNIPQPHLRLRPRREVEFVDGFQINSTIYLLANVVAEQVRVRLIWLDGRTNKVETLKSVQGVTLRCCAHRHRLLASAHVPGGPSLLLVGLFGTAGQSDRVLVLFNISQHVSQKTDPDFIYNFNKDSPGVDHVTLEADRVLFKRSFMTSVLAVRLKSWMVFFIGTEDGQLIKLVVDKMYQSVCPTVLYKSDQDQPVFRKLYLDPVGGKHVYVVLGNQLRREPVSDCEAHQSLQTCWSAQDPYCGWCASTARCTFKEYCSDSRWLSIPEDFSQQKIVSYHIRSVSSEQLAITTEIHLTVGTTEALTSFKCRFAVSPTGELCDPGSPPPAFPACTCLFDSSKLPAGGLHVTVEITIGGVPHTESLKLTNCSRITGPPTSLLCQRCIRAGCAWNENVCSWTHTGDMKESICQKFDSGSETLIPEIYSITPSVLSFHGKNGAMITGQNLINVTKVHFQRDMICSSKESPVWDNTGTSLMFHIPSGDKGLMKVCLVLPDGSCHGNASITYISSPACSSISPSTTWASGKRKMMITGTHLEFVEGICYSHKPGLISPLMSSNFSTLFFNTSLADNSNNTFHSIVSLSVANHSLACSSPITYHPDPIFTSFTSTRTGNDLRVTVQKTADKLELTTEELTIWGFHGGKSVECTMKSIQTSNRSDAIICMIPNMADAKIDSLRIHFGDVSFDLKPRRDSYLFLLILTVILPIPFIIVGALFYRSQQKLRAQMNKRLEELELDIRNDIRQGFVDLQTEKSEMMENLGAIPFLDYIHFASRTFFPEGGALMTSCLMDISQNMVQLDERCQALSRLIREQFFLTSMVHALEEQKNFTISDKCTVASLLTVILHDDLVYLTKVMEELLSALMKHPSNAQPKLMLRSTKSIVEKLLTNWMSICLYGFLRENIGQHLFLLVSALKQQIAKGPVDSVTEKALYTLSEDWLLWQLPDFTSLKLKVLFTVGSDGDVSEPLEVMALSCDTVEQLQEKILSTFKAKFGFSYNTRDTCIEFQKEGISIPLAEVDRSSAVSGAVTMLNTLEHYKVPDGASIKVVSKESHPPLSPQGSVKDDQDFEVKYFHLIDPDTDEDQKNIGRKKFKLKEVHLTKLLSTKVAVHSFVENLFQAIWATPKCRVPTPVKYFFDLLDTQADNMKLTDPDVIHIWKTNSLPLRFWVNILKNPQFVFEMEKTPHLDSCLSVIAQAFMDSFSLTDTQLGQYTPTNKLLYAKDVPQFKKEVRTYYKWVRDQPQVTSSEFKDFLLEESKKHNNEFNQPAALRELYKFIHQYYTEIQQKLDQNGAPVEMKEQLAYVKDLFDTMKSCSWN